MSRTPVPSDETLTLENIHETLQDVEVSLDRVVYLLEYFIKYYTGTLPPPEPEPDPGNREGPKQQDAA